MNVLGCAWQSAILTVSVFVTFAAFTRPADLTPVLICVLSLYYASSKGTERSSHDPGLIGRRLQPEVACRCRALPDLTDSSSDGPDDTSTKSSAAATESCKSEWISRTKAVTPIHGVIEEERIEVCHEIRTSKDIEAGAGI